MSSRTSNKRLPISCENYRKRKIACSGRQAPCHTCTRRGFASTCRFLKDSLPQPRTTQSISASEYDSLLGRISTLEQLLLENIESTRQALCRSIEHNDQPFASPSSIDTPQSLTYVHTGQLVRSVSGHVRYIPVDNAFRELNREHIVDTASLISVQSTEFPFSTSTTATKSQLLELLPPLSYCDELKNVFMDVFSPLFHILHDPKFEESYRIFRQNPNGVSLSFLALIFVVLAIAVTALEDDHRLLSDLGRESSAGANARIIAARFRNAAMRALSADNFLWQHNLHTLQTLVLLIYALSHAQGPAWPLLGATLNIAIAIGCHVDPSRYDVDIVEGEERRRCWAALTMLYTIQNTCMGNLSPMIIQADVNPPADLDDDVLSNMQSPEEVQERPVSATPSKMAYILHKFRLYRLASEICSLSASELWDESSALSLDQKVAAEESIQKGRFNHLEALPVYHQAHYYILSSYTNHLYLILHRPCLNIFGRDHVSSQPLEDGQCFNIKRLHQASTIILDNHEILHTTHIFRPYKWYTYGLGSFHAFLATTTMATILGDHLLRAQVDGFSVLRRLRQCLRRFEEASERSDVCAKAASILHRFLFYESQRAQHQQHDTHAAGAQDSDPQGHTASPQTLRLGNLSCEGQGMAWNGSTSTTPMTQQETGFLNTEGIDIDGWTANSDLQSVFSQLSSQQWLSPSSFPWSRWNEGGAAP